MKPTETGRLYDNIAPWGNAQQDASTTGLRFVQHAAQRPVIEKLCDALAPGGVLFDSTTKKEE